MGYFPMDANSLEYLRLTGRPEEKIKYIEAYLKAQGLYRYKLVAIGNVILARNYKEDADPTFSDVLHLDLSTIKPSLAGPKRPQDNVLLADMKKDFLHVRFELFFINLCSLWKLKLDSRDTEFPRIN